jgi:hypothetical protein
MDVREVDLVTRTRMEVAGDGNCWWASALMEPNIQVNWQVRPKQLWRGLDKKAIFYKLIRYSACWTIGMSPSWRPRVDSAFFVLSICLQCGWLITCSVMMNPHSLRFLLIVLLLCGRSSSYSILNPVRCSSKVCRSHFAPEKSFHLHVTFCCS